MISDELVPRLAALGLATEQVAVTGWSMGGYGALLMARDSGEGGAMKVMAAAAVSPALFRTASDTRQGAFDDADNWSRNGDLIGDSDAFDGARLFVATGRTDAFADPSRAFRDAVAPTPSSAIDKGCHDNDYWRSQVPDQFTFLSEQLAQG